MIAQQQRRTYGYRKRDRPQDEPAGSPSVHAEVAIEQWNQKTDEDDTDAVSAYDQPCGLAALVTTKPAGNQSHHGDIGETASNPHQHVIEACHGEVSAEAHAEQAYAEERKPDGD